MPKGGCIETLEWMPGVISDRCPVMYVEEHSMAFQAYIWAKRGFLPYGDNGWLQQPSNLLLGIDIIWGAVEAEELRRQKAAG